MTSTSGEPTAVIPKLYAVRLPENLTIWATRPSDDPLNKWSDKVLVPTQELEEWLNERQIPYETYLQKIKARPAAKGRPGRNSYHLAVRSYDRHFLALLVSRWQISVNHISSTWKHSSTGRLPANRASYQRSKSGSKKTKWSSHLTLGPDGRPMPAQSPL